MCSTSCSGSGPGLEPASARIPPHPGPPLEPPLGAVLDLIAAGATTVDRAAIEGGLAPREVAVALARLELLGYVAADALGGYAPTALAPP